MAIFNKKNTSFKKIKSVSEVKICAYNTKVSVVFFAFLRKTLYNYVVKVLCSLSACTIIMSIILDKY